MGWSVTDFISLTRFFASDGVPSASKTNDTLTRYYEARVGYKTFIIGSNAWNAFDVINVSRDLPELHIDFTLRIFNREDLRREQQNENYRN